MPPWDLATGWAAMVRERRDEFFMATTAIHKLGDISSDKPDYMRMSREDDENYYGAWVTGLGFFNVRFPKETTRPLSDEEFEWLVDHPVVIA